MKFQPRASHHVGGEYVEDDSGSPIDVFYPATGELIARVHSATPEIIERAVASAKTAQAEWARMKPVERARIMRAAEAIFRRRSDEIATIESHDTGRAFSETSVYDAFSVADALEFYAGIVPAFNGETFDFGESFAYTRREPLGVCLGIGAWNYPIQTMGWKVAPAVAAGNAIICKPSEMTPLSTLIVAEAFLEAGAPAGLVNVIQGRGDVGALLVDHPTVRKVSLTGSVPTGKKVYGAAASQMKYATMELGGKSPLIIFEDAAVDQAVNAALMANFYSTGQICTNGTRVFLHKSIHDQVLEQIVDRAAKIKVGDPFDPDTRMGPMNNEMQLGKVRNYIDAGKREGAKLECGGFQPEVSGMPGGYWIAPTIFSGVTDEMTIAKEEIFGPVMSVFSFDGEDEVVNRANSTSLGLAAGIFTRDVSRAHRVAAKLQSGTCWINTYGFSPIEFPFGGMKDSGVGRECARDALLHYTQTKSIYVESSPFESVF